MHIVSLAGKVKPLVEPRHLESSARVVGAFVLALHVYVAGKGHKQFILVQTVRVALRRWHNAERHIRDSSAVEQRRYVPVVAEGLCGEVGGCACAVPHAHFVAELSAHKSVHLHAQVPACAHGRRDGVQHIRHDDLGCERRRHGWHERTAKRRQERMSERCLELTYLDSERVNDLDVEPSLLKDFRSARRRVNRKVERHLVERLAGESEHSVRHRETGVFYVVLVIRLVQSLVVIPVETSGGLNHEVRLEHKVAFLRLNRKALAPSQRHYAVLRVLFFLLRHRHQRHRERQH